MPQRLPSNAYDKLLLRPDFSPVWQASSTAVRSGVPALRTINRCAQLVRNHWAIFSRSFWHSEAGKNPSLSRSEEHTSELQSRFDLVCRLLLEKKKIDIISVWLVTLF